MQKSLPPDGFVSHALNQRRQHSAKKSWYQMPMIAELRFREGISPLGAELELLVQAYLDRLLMGEGRLLTNRTAPRGGRN